MSMLQDIGDFMLGAFILAIPYWIVETGAAQNMLNTLVDLFPTYQE